MNIGKVAKETKKRIEISNPHADPEYLNENYIMDDYSLD
jgi:hypothetical protein